MEANATGSGFTGRTSGQEGLVCRMGCFSWGGCREGYWRVLMKASASAMEVFIWRRRVSIWPVI